MSAYQVWGEWGPFVHVCLLFLFAGSAYKASSRSDKASSTSGWVNAVSLNVKALRDILDTSPSLLLLKRITSQSVFFASSAQCFFEFCLALLPLYVPLSVLVHFSQIFSKGKKLWSIPFCLTQVPEGLRWHTLIPFSVTDLFKLLHIVNGILISQRSLLHIQ